jgi:hypothetical protein
MTKTCAPRVVAVTSVRDEGASGSRTQPGPGSPRPSGGTGEEDSVVQDSTPVPRRHETNKSRMTGMP